MRFNLLSLFLCCAFYFPSTLAAQAPPARATPVKTSQTDFTIQQAPIEGMGINPTVAPVTTGILGGATFPSGMGFGGGFGGMPGGFTGTVPGMAGSGIPLTGATLNTAAGTLPGTGFGGSGLGMTGLTGFPAAGNLGGAFGSPMFGNGLASGMPLKSGVGIGNTLPSGFLGNFGGATLPATAAFNGNMGMNPLLGAAAAVPGVVNNVMGTLFPQTSPTAAFGAAGYPAGYPAAAAFPYGGGINPYGATLPYGAGLGVGAMPYGGFGNGGLTGLGNALTGALGNLAGAPIGGPMRPAPIGGLGGLGGPGPVMPPL